MSPQRHVDIYKPNIRMVYRQSAGIVELYFSLHLLDRTHKLTMVATDNESLTSAREDLFGDTISRAERSVGVDLDEHGNIVRVYSDTQSYDVIDDPYREEMEWHGGA